MAVDNGLRTRRALLLGSIGAAAAYAANAFGRAAPVSAANGDPVKVGGGHASISPTAISMTSSSNGYAGAFAGITYGPSNGLFGQSAGTGGSGKGVMGLSSAGTGVHGESSSGYGMQGESRHNYGVYGTSGTSYAVIGLSDSSIGVVGLSGSGGGVFGQSGGSKPGVEGRSTNGRGGVFAGWVAQVRLEPSSAATHPPNGAAGDIFLDSSKRLWLCKGGASWVQLG